MAALPAQGVAALRGQRLRDEHVVVDGHDVAADDADERGEGARGEDGAAGGDAAGVGAGDEAGAVPLEACDGRALEHVHAAVAGGLGESPGEAGGVHDRAAVRHVGGAVVGGGADLLPGALGAPGLGAPAVAPGGLDELREPLGLVGLGGEGELAGLLEAGVDAVALHGLLDRGEVLAAELLELGHLAGPARHAVLDAVGEGGVHEAAVAAGGAERDSLALEQDDLPARVLLLRQQGGPEAGEARADHHEVGVEASAERIAGLRRTWLGEPEGPRLGVGVGALNLGAIHGHAAYDGDAVPEGWQSGRMRRS